MVIFIIMDYFYKGVDLRTASQNDLSEVLQLSPVLVSFENEISEDEKRVLGLFAFAENHNLEDLLSLLERLFS